MLNLRILKAWPNYFLIPAMLVFWVVLAVLLAELVGATSYRDQDQ